VHAGHLNAIRQGHAICGDNLVVAVLSDKAIEAAKGPTVLKIDERLQIVKACKWASNVVIVDEYYINERILDEQNCKFYIHGDDPVLDAEGNNTVD
jgi:ethanolamine-phosphate cytidylyltransferase